MRQCPRCCKGKSWFEAAVELAVIYPDFLLLYAERWP